MNSGATISECGLYRTDLFRVVGVPTEMPIEILYVGVNPSTAGLLINDHTITKLCEFTKRSGAFRFSIVNLFAYRATDVKELATVPDPVGRWNNKAISDAMARADIIVPMWGSRNKLPKVLRPRIDEVVDGIRRSNKLVMTFGFTKTGDPKHPLMLGYDTKLTLWNLE